MPKAHKKNSKGNTITSFKKGQLQQPNTAKPFLKDLKQTKETNNNNTQNCNVLG